HPAPTMTILAVKAPLPVTPNAVEYALRRPGRRHAQQLLGAAHALLPFHLAQPLGNPGTGGDGRGNASGVHHGNPDRTAAQLQTQGGGEAPDGTLAGTGGG